MQNVTYGTFSFQHYAARSGHSKVCEMLLKKGAHVNSITKSGCMTALQRAAYAGHLHVVTLLIRWHADVMHQDTDGKTALHKVSKLMQINSLQKYIFSVLRTHI